MFFLYFSRRDERCKDQEWELQKWLLWIKNFITYNNVGTSCFPVNPWNVARNLSNIYWNFYVTIILDQIKPGMIHLWQKLNYIHIPLHHLSPILFLSRLDLTDWKISIQHHHQLLILLLLNFVMPYFVVLLSCLKVARAYCEKENTLMKHTKSYCRVIKSIKKNVVEKLFVGEKKSII